MSFFAISFDIELSCPVFVDSRLREVWSFSADGRHFEGFGDAVAFGLWCLTNFIKDCGFD